MHIAIDIPDSVLGVIAPDQDPARAAVEALALEGYRSGRLGESAVRRLLGFDNRLDVDAFLSAHGLNLPYTMADIERDTETALETARRARSLRG